MVLKRKQADSGLTEVAQPEEASLFTGTVKSYNPEKGYGFISCQETFDHFGQDVFLLRSHVEGEGLNVGEDVTFRVRLNTKGQPQAHSVNAFSGPERSRRDDHSDHPRRGDTSGRPRRNDQSDRHRRGDHLEKLERSRRDDHLDEEIKRRPRPTNPPSEDVGSRSYSGVVKSYNQSKGWGFIECQDTHQRFGQDVFLMKNQANSSGASPGDEVSFRVNLNRRGQPQAHEVISGNVPQQGRVKSFNDKTGYGFIECEDTFRCFGQDVFLLRSEMENCGHLQAGQEVQFNILVSDRQQPRAINITVIGSSPGPPLKRMRRNREARSPEPPSRNDDDWEVPRPSRRSDRDDRHDSRGDRERKRPPPAPAPPRASPYWEEDRSTATYYGTVRSFNPKRGFGFIDSPKARADFGWDVFLRKPVVERAGLQVGDEVSFSVEMSGNGQPQATNVKLVSAGPGPRRSHQDDFPVEDEPDGPPDDYEMEPDEPDEAYQGEPPQGDEPEVYYGEVKSNNPEKWGFIKCEETYQIYKRDVFLLKSELPPAGLKIGDQVSFQVRMNVRGHPQAINISVM